MKLNNYPLTPMIFILSVFPQYGLLTQWHFSAIMNHDILSFLMHWHYVIIKILVTSLPVCLSLPANSTEFSHGCIFEHSVNLPLRQGAQTTDTDRNEADKPTPWRGKNLALTSLPSVSKTSKSSVMRYCVGATSCQTQFLFGGYSRGQPGLVMEPFSLVMKPPHAARGTNRER